MLTCTKHKRSPRKNTKLFYEFMTMSGSSINTRWFKRWNELKFNPNSSKHRTLLQNSRSQVPHDSHPVLLLNIARFVRPSLNLIYPMTVGMPITVPEDFNYNTMNSRGDYNYCHRFFVTIWKSTTTNKRVTLKRNCGMGLPFTPNRITVDETNCDWE